MKDREAFTSTRLGASAVYCRHLPRRARTCVCVSRARLVVIRGTLSIIAMLCILIYIYIHMYINLDSTAHFAHPKADPRPPRGQRVSVPRGLRKPRCRGWITAVGSCSTRSGRSCTQRYRSIAWFTYRAHKRYDKHVLCAFYATRYTAHLVRVLRQRAGQTVHTSARASGPSACSLPRSNPMK